MANYLSYSPSAEGTVGVRLLARVAVKGKVCLGLSGDGATIRYLLVVRSAITSSTETAGENTGVVVETTVRLLEA